MEEDLTTVSITPDLARAQYLDHLSGCDRCRNRRQGRRGCRTGRGLRKTANRASAALIGKAKYA